MSEGKLGGWDDAGGGLAEGMLEWGREYDSGLRLGSYTNPRSGLVPLTP